MIEVTRRPFYRRPYADEENVFEVKATGMTEDEVKQYCLKEVCRVSKSKADQRFWYEPYYEFYKNGEDTYLFKVVTPNCE